MKVYRICNIDEYNIILNEHSLSSIGRIPKNDKMLNDHNYQADTRYMHFFQRMIDIGHWLTEEGRYLCTYDIPDDLLEKHKGTGRYPVYQEWAEVSEYAIPSSLISFDYLKKMEYMDPSISWDDLINNTYRRKLSTVYEIKGPILLRRKREQ